MTPPLHVIDAGLVPYDEALAWQRRLAEERIADRSAPDVLLLVEHPHVVTLGRGSHNAHLLNSNGIDVVEVERGGDVTYHGPGQLVGYPIIDLTQHRADLHWYLRSLERALIAPLAELGIDAGVNPPYTGVWTNGRKIASIGVHVKRWVTWHGFALNVTTDLAQFERIVPCGIAGVEMTSVERELGARNAERGTRNGNEHLWNRSLDAVVRGFERTFGLEARVESVAPYSFAP